MVAFKTISLSIEESELLRKAGVGCPPEDTCGTYPCRHTPCLDPDYLADLHDKIFSSKHYWRLWRLWYLPEARNTIPESEREMYEAKFQRCQRVKDKSCQIRREIDLRHRQMQGLDESFLDEDSYRPCPEVEEAIRKQVEVLRSRLKLN